MKTKQIEKYLVKAAKFRQLADPDTNHLQATGHSTMLPARAAARAQYWEDRAAGLLASGIARKKPKT